MYPDTEPRKRPYQYHRTNLCSFQLVSYPKGNHSTDEFSLFLHILEMNHMAGTLTCLAAEIKLLRFIHVFPFMSQVIYPIPWSAGNLANLYSTVVNMLIHALWWIYGNISVASIPMNRIACSWTSSIQKFLLLHAHPCPKRVLSIFFIWSVLVVYSHISLWLNIYSSFIGHLILLLWQSLFWLFLFCQYFILEERDLLPGDQWFPHVHKTDES